MAIYQTKYITRVRNFAQPDDSDIDLSPVDIDFPTAALLVNDIIQLVEIPAGVTLQNYNFHFPKIDSSGAPTLAFSFGVLNALGTDLATVYATGIIAGQTNAVVNNTNTDCAQDFANNVLSRKIGLKVTAACATYGGAGKVGQFIVQQRG